MTIANGNLYLTDSGSHTVRRIVPATGEVSTIAGLAIDERAPAPRAIAFAGGELHASSGEAIYRLASPAALIAGRPEQVGHRDGVGQEARFRGPVALGSLPGGDLVVGEINGEVRRVSPRTGRVTTVADIDAFLFSMGVDHAGDIYVGRLFAIDRISLDGKRSVVVSRDGNRHPDAIVVPSLDTPVGMALDGDRLYVLDENDNYRDIGFLVTLRRIDLQARTAEALASWRFSREKLWSHGPRGLALTANKQALWITHPTGVLSQIELATGLERGVIVSAGNSTGVTLGSSPSINAPSMPTLAPDNSLVFIDEGAALRLR